MKGIKSFFGACTRFARKTMLIVAIPLLVIVAFYGGLNLLAEQAPPHRRSHSEILPNGCTLLYDGLDMKRYMICPDGLTSGATIEPMEVAEAPHETSQHDDGWGPRQKVTIPPRR